MSIVLQIMVKFVYLRTDIPTNIQRESQQISLSILGNKNTKFKFIFIIWRSYDSVHKFTDILIEQIFS